MRGDADFGKPCLVLADTEHITIHPFDHAAEHIVVERVHACIAETVLFGVTVPAFPNGSSTIFHRV